MSDSIALHIHQHTKKQSFTLKIVLLSLILLEIHSTAVSWSSYPDIIAGQIIAYPGPALVNSNTPPVSYSVAVSLSNPAAPINVAFGINKFQVPNDQDFSIITNKTFTNTNLNLRVYLQDDTVCMKLYFNYVAMITTSLIFRMISDQISPTVISDSFGYRSETDIISTSDPFFTSTTLTSALVLEGIRVDPSGDYSFVDTVVTVGQNGDINTTFITFQQITITYISYSIIFCDKSQADVTTQLIFRIGTIKLTNDSSIASTFFSTIDNDSRYKGAAGRMFFGISSFNFSVAATKIFGFDSSNFGSLYSSYIFSNSITEVKLSYFFFVQRACPGTTYFYNNWGNPSLDTCVATCSGYPDRPNDDNVYKQCLACDSTCLTCSGITSSTCQTCDSLKFRVLAGTAPSSCNCMSNYVEVGGICVLCSTQIVGCLTCSSTTTCSTCSPGFVEATCTCPNGSIINGFCNSVNGCTNISTINGTQTCINCDATLYYQLNASFFCQCMPGTTTLTNKSCQPKCGDNYVLTVQGCDDGNNLNGDGCSAICTVEQDWVCVTTAIHNSLCKIDKIVQLTYLGAFRDTSFNTGIFYYKISPIYAQYQMIDFNTLFATNLSYYKMKVEYNPEQELVMATVDYTQDIENAQFQFQILLHNSQYFWSPTNIVRPVVSGINCELTFDLHFHLRNGFYYTLMVLLFSSLLVFIISALFFQKWIGLELILTFQSYYFLFALIKAFPFQLSFIPEVLKYSQGYDGILSGQYYRTYTLSNYLLTLGVQKQFISNFNTMYLLIIASIIVLIILGLRKRKLKLMLEEVVSSDINKKVKKAEKMFSFVFGRIFMMIVFYSMYKIVFSFCIQLSNQQSALQFFPDELNVAAGIIAFVILFSMISYVLYWYILLPDNFTQQQEFMSLSFQNMQFNYPIIYLGYQALFILTLSILPAEAFIVYIILSLQIIYLIFLIIYRPYNTIHRLNRLIHNVTIIFNQASSITCLAIIMRWNKIIGTAYQTESDSELAAYSILLIFMLFVSLGLTIFRLAIFNKEVSFKCCKKKQQDENYQQAIDYESMKKMENYRKQEFFNRQQKNIEMSILANLRPESIVEEPEKRKKVTNEPIENINEAQIDAYLNDKTIHWNKQALVSKNTPKLSYINIKRSASGARAQLKKSSLQLYLQSKRKREEGSQDAKDK